MNKEEHISTNEKIIALKREIQRNRNAQIVLSRMCLEWSYGKYEEPEETMTYLKDKDMNLYFKFILTLEYIFAFIEAMKGEKS